MDTKLLFTGGLCSGLIRPQSVTGMLGTRLTWRNFHARLSNHVIDILEYYTQLVTHQGTRQDVIPAHSPQFDPESDPQLGVGLIVRRPCHQIVSGHIVRARTTQLSHAIVKGIDTGQRE